MRKLQCLLFLFACILLLNTSAHAITYQEGVRAARDQNKPLYLYFYSDGWPYCRMMDRSVLGDKEIEPTLKKDFVYVRIDVDKTTDLAKLYGIRGFPSSWFLEPSGGRILEVPGYIDKSLFKKVLQYVKGGHYKTTDVNDYLKKK